MKMKKTGRIVRRGMPALAVLMFLVPTLSAYDSASGQSSRDQHESYKNYAKTEPISNRRFTFQFTFENGRTASATQLEGGLIRVESTKNSTILGLTPLVSEDGSVQIKVFKVEPIRHLNSLIGESLSEIETLDLHQDEARISSGVFNFSVRLADHNLLELSEKKTL